MFWLLCCCLINCEPEIKLWWFFFGLFLQLRSGNSEFNNIPPQNQKCRIVSTYLFLLLEIQSEISVDACWWQCLLPKLHASIITSLRSSLDIIKGDKNEQELLTYENRVTPCKIVNKQIIDTKIDFIPGNSMLVSKGH